MASAHATQDGALATVGQWQLANGAREAGGDHGASDLMAAPARGVTEPEGNRMSRTDKTRPWWVRMADAPMVTCLPVHDHRFGPCSLPDEITADNACLGTNPGSCYWGTSYDRIGRVDGAREWYHIRREDRRRSRYRARRELRGYRREG
jgi:hypothetical protein